MSSALTVVATPSLTAFLCRDPFQAMLEQLAADQIADEHDIDARLDNLARLAGPCEACREEADQLVILGGDALCQRCVEALGLDYNAKIEESWVPVAPAEVDHGR